MKLCRIAFALVICLFVPVQGQPCSCIGGCDNTTIDFPGSDEKMVDVAYGKPANMSSIYISPQEGTSGPACMAVNGKTGTVFRTLKTGNPNCFHTADTDTNAWWEVDLGRNHTITNITIYRREGAHRRMSGIHVEVDSQTCYTFPLMAVNETALDNLPEKIDVTCTPPLTGRVLRLQKRGQPYNYDYRAQIINVCEVQVWGCADAYVGPDCQCGHCRDGARCDVTTLECPGGCDRGWRTPFCNQICPVGTHGNDCGEECGQCADSDTCNTVTGFCPNGCQSGWQEDNCKQECDAAKYGNNCSSSCGHCNTDDVCHHINGTCPYGCAAGFDPSDPLCTSSCPEGKYGSGCLRDCGNCRHDAVCNATSGVCPGGCDPGWTKPLCTEVCPSGSFGDNCNMKCSNCSQDRCHNTDGECLEGCKPGYQWNPQHHFCNQFCQNGGYGDNCSEPCGHCSGGDKCDPFTGTCTSCQPQLQPPLCKVCTGKRYGASCDLNCSRKCGGDGSCEQDSGRCVGGCVAGYRPGQSGFCSDVCEEGKYGEGCSKECGKCTHSCRHDDGLCIGGCFDGYTGPYCAQTSESSPNLAGPVAGAVFGGLCVIALSILVGLLIRRSRKRSSSETASPPPTSANQSFEPGAPAALNGQAALPEETGSAGVTESEESHIYDGLQTPDDSDRAPYSTPVFKGQQDKGRNSHTYQNPAWHASDTGNDYYNL